MLTTIRTSLMMLVTLTVVTGGVYPLLVTGLGQVLFPHQANGSLIRDGDRIVGSELIGQSFDDPALFWGRLSATGAGPYNASASGGSNLGPRNPDLIVNARQRIAALTADGTPATSIPVDLVTSSASGLDPHISPAAAEFQVRRIAAARSVPEDRIRQLVAQHTQGRQFGVLGEPRVNVLLLNLSLEAVQ